MMCVQYHGGCSAPWDIIINVEGYHDARGGVQYREVLK